MISEDNAYVVRVFKTLRQNPTEQHIDFLVEAYTRVGYLAAIAQGEADAAEDERKYAEASTWRKVKDENPKATAAQVDAIVFTTCYDYRKTENKRAEEALKLRNLQDSIKEAINAVKFLSRGDNSVRLGP